MLSNHPPLIGDDDSDLEETVRVWASGGGVPEPVEGFKEAGLAEAVLQKMWTYYGFETPTPLQQYLVPVVLAGRNLLACAPTGSGKTAAFSMSVVSVLLAGRRKEDRGDTAAASVVYHAGPRPRALLLALSEERARKIQEYARNFSYRTGLRVELIYGGTTEYKQQTAWNDMLRQLANGMFGTIDGGYNNTHINTKYVCDDVNFSGDVQHKFGELCNQCFSVDVSQNKIFHHYNFTVEIKHADSDIWTSQVYFAEVKQLSDVKHYFCCPLKESDKGRCYGCKNQQMDHLKHPSNGGYEEGNPDIRWPFMDDTPDSDDSGDSDR